MGAKTSTLAVLAVLGWSSSLLAAPSLHVYKSPYCSCCDGWVQYMKKEGFDVKVTNTEDTAELKDRLGVPPSLRSCHTSTIDRYVVEGHTPAEAVRKLLAGGPPHQRHRGARHAGQFPGNGTHGWHPEDAGFLRQGVFRELRG